MQNVYNWASQNSGNYVSAPQNSSSGFSWGYVAIGVFITAVIAVIIYVVVGRATTRPIKQGFFAGPINGTSDFPCSRASSEASELIAIFSTRGFTITNEDFRDLRDLLSKLCCMKVDLMAPQHTITATKELGFATHMDIQPVADLIGRCFSKTVPERDLSIQFIKWRDYAGTLLRRLCTEANLTEQETQKAEQLFLTCWKDVNTVAQVQCLSGPAVGPYTTSPHEPSPSADEGDEALRPYDGYY